MDGGIAVIRSHALGNQNRVFVVVTIPRHESDGHILTQCQLAQIGRCAVGHQITALQHVARFHGRTLIDVGGLVRTGEFHQIVDIHTHFTGNRFIIVYTHHHTVGVNILDHTAATRHNGCRRIHRYRAFDAGTHQGFLGTQTRYRLTLHVGTHQSTVGIVMFQERNQRSRYRYHLTSGHVHILHAIGGRHDGLAFFATGYQFVDQIAFVIQLGIGLRNHETAFFNGRQIIDLIGYFTVFHATVRSFQEAVIIGTRINRQRVDQTNVRTLRGFNRAHATVVSRVYVAHFKAGTLTGQTARTQGRYAAFMGDFRQGIGLIHKLAQLAGAEEFFNRSGNRFGVNQISRHQIFRFRLIQTLFHRTLYTRQA